MLFIQSDELKIGMRLAKPIYNKNGIMLYERNSKLTGQGILSIRNFGLIGVYILEPAEPAPPMTEEDMEFERFQAMAVFSVKEILDAISKNKEPEGMYQFANQIIKRYGSLYHKINFVQNLRSAEDAVYKHALNTAILCALLSNRMKLEFKDQLDVVVAGFLYDIGNLLLPISLRKKKEEELSEEERDKVYTYYFAGYQLINQDYNIDASVRRIVSVMNRQQHQLGTEEELRNPPDILEVDILKVAAAFDNMTAMKYGEEPLSEVKALRFLLEERNGFNQQAVQALTDSIYILQPGVCVELSNGDRALVVEEGLLNVLRPFVLSFRDNQLLNLGDDSVFQEVQVKDIMKTMDKRHMIDHDMLKNHPGGIEP